MGLQYESKFTARVIHLDNKSQPLFVCLISASLTDTDRGGLTFLFEPRKGWLGNNNFGWQTIRDSGTLPFPELEISDIGCTSQCAGQRTEPAGQIGSSPIPIMQARDLFKKEF